MLESFEMGPHFGLRSTYVEESDYLAAAGIPEDCDRLKKRGRDSLILLGQEAPEAIPGWTTCCLDAIKGQEMR